MAQKLEESGMRVISYVASLFCLYLVVWGWSFLWGIHFLLATGIVLIVTAADRNKVQIG